VEALVDDISTREIVLVGFGGEVPPVNRSDHVDAGRTRAKAAAAGAAK
jgi:hypothetical protein